MMLAGCGIGGHWMTGNPISSPPKPYMSYWHKNDVTEEDRRADWVACGGMRDGNSITDARLSSETDDFAASRRTHHRLDTCMNTKGYRYLNQL